jgi:hypothetical protein
MKKLSPDCGLAIQCACRCHGRDLQFGFWVLVLRSENGDGGGCTVLCSSVCREGKHWFRWVSFNHMPYVSVH